MALHRIEEKRWLKEKPALEEENKTLKAKIAYYEKELEIVKWYISVFEDG